MDIKFCKNNFTHGTEDVAAKLVDNYPELSVVVEDCLGHCGDCAPGPYAIVNDKLIKGKTCEELYEKIEEII
jgi:uncharacterized protein YuzB (UPF0349 family)